MHALVQHGRTAHIVTLPDIRDHTIGWYHAACGIEVDALNAWRSADGGIVLGAPQWVVGAPTCKRCGAERIGDHGGQSK